MSRIIAAAIVVMATLAAAQPAPPVIPVQWQASFIQAFWSVNQTTPQEFAGQIYWDYNTQSIREDFAISGGSFVTFNNYATQTTNQIQTGYWYNNVPKCIKQPLTGSMVSRNLFAEATYAGQMEQNDILCDVWWVIVPSTEGPSRPNDNVTMWWNTPANAPVQWTTVAVDGSQFSEFAIWNFEASVQSGVNTPPTPLCAEESDEELEFQSFPKAL